MGLVPCSTSGAAKAMPASHSRSSVTASGSITTSYVPASSDAGLRDIAADADGTLGLLGQPQRADVAVHVPAVPRGASRARRLERPHAEGGDGRVVRARASARRRERVGDGGGLEHARADEARVADGGEHRRQPLDALLRGRARGCLGVAPPAAAHPRVRRLA